MVYRSSLAALFDERGDSAERGAASMVERALQTLRKHLRMDLAFISEFRKADRIFRYVDTSLANPPVRAGDILPIDDGYCLKVVDGRLPQLIPNTADCLAALSISATKIIPIGAHVSVPLHRVNGEVYGTLCCFNLKPDLSLTQRDLEITHAFAELIGQQIESEMRGELEKSEKRRTIAEAIDSNDPVIVYQPICQLKTMQTVSCEALARFSSLPSRSPDKWFADAGDVGLRADLELKAIENALVEFGPLWRNSEINLSLNSSAQTIASGRIGDAFEQWPPERLILEITEHDQVEDYGRLLRALAPLKRRGVRIAIDDAGSGFASMRHILEIGPDIIKLDVSLTRDIDRDPRRRALAAAFVTFGHQIGSKIIGEGVETQQQLNTLKELGVEKAQGYFIGRPAPVSALLADR